MREGGGEGVGLHMTMLRMRRGLVFLPTIITEGLEYKMQIALLPLAVFPMSCPKETIRCANNWDIAS